MTGITIRWRAFIDSIGMTSLAFHIGMAAPQREPRVVVVEGHVLPTARVMTGRAIRAKLPSMLVVSCVAGKAIFGRSFEHPICVTGRALDIRVASL